MMSILKIKKDDIYTISVFSIITIVIISSYPYVFSLFLPLPSFLVMQVFAFTSLILISMIFKCKLKSLSKNLTVVLVLQILVWLCFVVIHKDTTYFTRITYLVVSYLSLICLCNCNKGVNGYFKGYNNWIAFMSVAGAATFFIVLFTGMPPLFEFVEQDQRQGYFLGLTTTNTIIGNIIRYAGFFDEPGQMAFWGVWALLFNVSFIKNEKLEKILIIALVFTFSIAYYIQLFFYLLLFKIKNFKTILIVCVIVVIVGCGIYSTKDSDFDLYRLTFYRLEMDSYGKMQGDNRSNLSENAKKVFSQHPIFGAGARNATENMPYMGDNPYTLLAYDGIIGLINTYLPIIFILLYFFKVREFWKLFIIIALGYAQRPFSNYFLSSFILYSFVILSYYKYNVKNNSNNSLFQRRKDNRNNNIIDCKSEI